MTRALWKIDFMGDTVYNEDENRSLSPLGELLTIKLTEILREEKSGVYAVNASGSISKIPSGQFVFSIVFPCGSANANSLINAALAEIAEIQNGQINESDINKVKERRLVKIKELMKDNSFWMGLIADNAAQGDKIPTLEEAETRINSINKEDIQKAAKKYLISEQRKQFVLIPEIIKE